LGANPVIGIEEAPEPIVMISSVADMHRKDFHSPAPHLPRFHLKIYEQDKLPIEVYKYTMLKVSFRGQSLGILKKSWMLYDSLIQPQPGGAPTPSADHPFHAPAALGMADWHPKQVIFSSKMQARYLIWAPATSSACACW
jgi:hypothetical protein